jgi:hypothetical protein
LILPAIALALVAAAFFFTRYQQPVPSASAAVPSHRSIDLGAGYRLELSDSGGQIVAPAAVMKPQPADSVKTMDLGGGYKLVPTQRRRSWRPVKVQATQAADWARHRWLAPTGRHRPGRYGPWIHSRPWTWAQGTCCE